MSYEIVSFDLDGTLVDTANEIAEAANRVLEAHGIARQSVSEITTCIGHGTRELILQLFNRAAQDDPSLTSAVTQAQLFASMDEHYAATTGTCAVPYDGVFEALQRLHQDGVKLACVTNKELRHARRVLRVTGLEPYFELAIGGDTLPYKKPHPTVLQHVLERLGGRAGSAAHIGDSHIDVQAARNAGVAAWAVPYGYNGGVAIAVARPDRIFPSILQMAEHVLERRAARSQSRSRVDERA